MRVPYLSVASIDLLQGWPTGAGGGVDDAGRLPDSARRRAHHEAQRRTAKAYYGIHGATAAVMAAAGVVLLLP
ncbi:hypothetical protein ABCR94_16975 [Streptomyces sp. 21So2-11]|uniref:hypothetical protein n=1 Tax=Streptomyces sp. 21So2-11 TaxID=3144408 RepID=UPI003219BD41